MVLHYSDDCLSACTSTKTHQEFKSAFSEKFDSKWQPSADWYLSARIQRDADGNILLDQKRYCISIVQRYLPNAESEPSAADLRRYEDPLPKEFKWLSADCSATKDDVINLEHEYGFRFIEAVGSLNYLVNTSYRILFAVRKACKFTTKPGRQHFRALLHLLHHLRCFPVKAMKFYRDVSNAPLTQMLKEAGHGDVDPSFVFFTDSSFMDCDDLRSTGSHLGFIQGGIVDLASGVPIPISMSTCEAEAAWMSLCMMSAHYISRGFCEILFDDPDRLYTVPVFTDSQAALDLTRNEKDSKRTRHMERRFQYCRVSEKTAKTKSYHINGDDFMLSDIGTKAVPVKESEHKLAIFEADCLDRAE